MKLHREPPLGSTGKLLEFPIASPSAASWSHSLRHAKSDRWQVRVWLLLAWLVAFNRLQIAVARRDVFDLQDGLAFIVAVVMPFVSAQKIWIVLGEVLAALHRGWSACSRSRTRNARANDCKRV